MSHDPHNHESPKRVYFGIPIAFALSFWFIVFLSLKACDGSSEHGCDMKDGKCSKECMENCKKEGKACAKTCEENMEGKTEEGKEAVGEEKKEGTDAAATEEKKEGAEAIKEAEKPAEEKK